MNKNEIHEFLNSGLLESYAMGSLDENECKRVEHLIQTVPDIQTAFDDLQGDLETLGSKLAVKPPLGTKEGIMKSIEGETPSASDTTKSFNSQAWLLGALALALGLTSMFFFNKTRLQKEEINNLKREYAELKSACDQKEEEYKKQQSTMNFMASINASKYLLQDKNGEFTSAAYVNRPAQTAHLHILSMPTLPNDKCLQLWADIDGEMISMRVLPNGDEVFLDLPFHANMTSLNVTIEPKGGSKHPTVTDLIAVVEI